MTSLKEGFIITGVTIGSFMVVKYLFKISPPTAKLDINDASKIKVISKSKMAPVSKYIDKHTPLVIKDLLPVGNLIYKAFAP